MLHALAITGILVGCALTLTHRRRRILPPGPSGFPIVGNIRELNPSTRDKHSWVSYAELSECYGDVVYLEVLKQPFVILNSAKAAVDLLEKRSANYSDRPVSTMVNELMGWEWNFGLMQYSDRWRKTFHEFFQPRAIPLYFPAIHRSNARLLQDLLLKPDKFATHVRNYAASIILGITYDYEIQEDNDPVLQATEGAMDSLARAVNAGSFYVDIFPALKYIPAWFPGAGFQRKAQMWKDLSTTSRDTPFNYAKDKLMKGSSSTSFVARSLRKLEERADLSEDMEEVIKNCAGVGYIAGTDTTVALLMSFILAMVLNPAVVEKAQKELDSIVGSSRLPEFSDRPNLPYVDAILSETLRWLPVAPLGIPRKSVSDDVYDGYLIPGGSIVIANLWAMLHDPVAYPQPAEFRPERFVPCDGQTKPPDPAMFAFSLGRRICPGRHLALQSVWLAIASLLTVFNFDKAKDSMGNVITPVADCNEGAACHPLPFQCVIKPRSSEAALLIERLADA